MTTKLITKGIWGTLTRAVKESKSPCHVAVAYFGQGASKMLPLKSGSRLLVDASERTVTLGLTCPEDLMILQKKGVMIFSLENLHAKVYVIGKSVYIGSANVSQHSANTLVETLLCTTDSRTVKKAIEFIDYHKVQMLGPEMLKELKGIYRPPRFASRKRSSKKSKKRAHIINNLPELHLVQLIRDNWSEREQDIHDKGEAIAIKLREHPRTHILDSFLWTGKCDFNPGDVVIQVTNEGNGKKLIHPPGNVLSVKAERIGNRNISFVFLECLNKKRRDLKRVARHLGRGFLKLLNSDGIIKNANYAHSMLKLFNS